jgi:conjugative transposon TraN protein
MKKLVLFLTLVWVGCHCFAQNTPFADGVKKHDLPIIYLPENVSVQFISPEPIQYVDISEKNVIGDLPLKNVLRIRLKDSVKTADAVVTITGEKYIAQYHILSADPITGRDAVTEIAINPADTRPLDIGGVSLSQPQLKSMALNLFCKKPGNPIEHTKAFGLKASLYRIYSAGDYIFLNLGYDNRTNLKYDLDELRFKVDDKKITKATNVQSVEIKPEYVLFDNPVFQHSYRNIIVLKKMTFPGDKVLHIELSEKQISGRVITLTISYKDVLDADVIPL